MSATGPPRPDGPVTDALRSAGYAVPHRPAPPAGYTEPDTIRPDSREHRARPDTCRPEPPGIRHSYDASAAVRSRANSSAIVCAVQCAFSPLGLGSAQILVPPIVRSCGPIRAFLSPKAVR